MVFPVAGILFHAARWVATKYIRNAALKKVAAGGTLNAVNRFGYRAQGGAENLMGGWARTPQVAGMYPNLAGRLAPPTVPFGARIKAKPTLGGKAMTTLAAPARPLIRTSPAMVAGGLEVAGWSGTAGKWLEDRNGPPQATLVNTPSRANPGGEAPPNPWGVQGDIMGNPWGVQGGIYGPTQEEWDDPMRVPAPPPRQAVTPGSWERGLAATPTLPEPAPAPAPRPAPTVELDVELEGARDDFDRDMAGLNAGYKSMIAQLSSMYQLSETEDEKAQLRFTLADLEAQFKAGNEAISNLYVDKTATIRTLAARSRTETGDAATAASRTYSDAAVDLRALEESRNAAQVASNRGMGIGGVQDNPYEGLLHTMAPIAGEYAQRVGDIGSEGLDYLASLNESTGAARQGELQSLYASSHANSTRQHLAQVAQRVATERLAAAAAMQSVMQAQLSARQSMISGRDRNTVKPSAVHARIEEMAVRSHGSPQNFADMFASEFGRAPKPYEWSLFEDFSNYYRTAEGFEIREAEQRQRLGDLEINKGELEADALLLMQQNPDLNYADALREVGILE